MQSIGGMLGFPQSPPGYTPAQNSGFSGILGGMPNVQQFGSLGPNMLGAAQGIYDTQMNNPYASLGLGGALGAAGMGGQAAGDQFGTGQYLTGAGLGMLPYAGAIMNTGFDPQNALYARTAQQVQDQIRAGEAARGIAMTPYGAGLENQGMSNFNIDWQNNLLNRQAQAAQAAGGLFGASGNLAGQGIGMETGAPNTLYSTAMLPYATYTGMGQNQYQALMNLMGYGAAGQNLANVPVQDWLNTMQAGTAQQNAATNLYNAQNNQTMDIYKALGGIGSGIGGLMSLGNPLSKLAVDPFPK
jgi:hypothetical protein